MSVYIAHAIVFSTWRTTNKLFKLKKIAVITWKEDMSIDFNNFITKSSPFMH